MRGLASEAPLTSAKSGDPDIKRLAIWGMLAYQSKAIVRISKEGQVAQIVSNVSMDFSVFNLRSMTTALGYFRPGATFDLSIDSANAPGFVGTYTPSDLIAWWSGNPAPQNAPNLFVMAGENLGYDNFGRPVSGNITGLYQKATTAFGTDFMVMAGFSLSAVATFAAWESASVTDDQVTLNSILSGNDQITCSDFNDRVFGRGGNDRLFGNAGNDTLAGDSGNDALWGGADNDFLSGGTENDVLQGGLGNDRLSGDAGNDTLAGDGGNDSLWGGADNDFLKGGTGNDLLQGGLGGDRLLGEAGNDTLAGDGGNDSIWGGADNDFLKGGTGNDLLQGGLGGDRLLGEAGNDTLAGDGGNDSIWGGEDNDFLKGGTGNDVLRGGLGNDRLSGDADNDTLAGDGGADQLQGGLGRDLLYGGADSVRDVFVFAATADSSAGTSRDVIYNFASGVDDIALSAIDANASVTGNQAFGWGGNVAGANKVWFTTANGNVTVFADTTGDRVADFSVVVVGVTSLTAGDFIL